MKLRWYDKIFNTKRAREKAVDDFCTFMRLAPGKEAIEKWKEIKK